MINNDIFKNRVNKLGDINLVLDVGCGYPYRLIELLHKDNPNKCIGVDLIEEEYIVSMSCIESKIEQITNIDLCKISRIIYDEDIKVNFYNSYKVYTSLILDVEPFSYEEFLKKLDLKFKKSIETYLNETKELNYDVIIISKVLSHIDSDKYEEVLDRLIQSLSEKGIIYLRVNSEDFKVSKDQIKHVFHKEKIANILSKLKNIDGPIEIMQNGKRVYEIIGMRK